MFQKFGTSMDFWARCKKAQETKAQIDKWITSNLKAFVQKKKETDCKNNLHFDKEYVSHMHMKWG